MNIGLLPSAGKSTVIMSDSSLYQSLRTIRNPSPLPSLAEVDKAIKGEVNDANSMDKTIAASQFLFVFKVFHQKRLGKSRF
jgi:hypothetical protein